MSKVKKKIPNIRLWIVGNGSYKSNLITKVNDAGLQDSIFFFNYMPHDDLIDLLLEADIALIPHMKSEQSDNSSPNKLYEYAYASKPVLCSNCNSLERLVSEMQNGMIYINDLSDSFAEICVKLVREKDLKTMGESGKIAVINKHNWENSVTALLNIYRGNSTNTNLAN